MIEQGDYKSAVSHPTAAVQITKACTVPENGEEEKEEGSSSYDEWGAGIIMSNLDGLISKRDTSSDDDGYLIFDRPIRIPEPCRHNNVTRYPSRVQCATVATFNLALTYHLQGLIPSAHSYVSLQKATKLYEYAMQFAQRLNNGLTWLLLLNNLSDVYRRLDDGIHAEQCCEDLLCTLVHISDSKQVSDDLRGIPYRNSFCILISSRGVAVASAA